MEYDRFKKLETWRQSMRFTDAVYQLTRAFPPEERSGLTATLRRGSAGIPAAIAATAMNADPAQRMSTLETAMGQLREIETHLTIARNMRYIGWMRVRALRRRLGRLYELFEDTADQLQDQIQLRERATAGRIGPDDEITDNTVERRNAA